MDADGLPLVGPGIDYTKVEAINQKRTIAFINHFVTHTSRFLNRFSCVCEEKLQNLSGRLQQLEISLNILEAKISSIPGLESVTAPQSSASTAPIQDNVTTASSSAGSSAPPPPPPPPQSGQGAPPPTAEPAAPEPTADPPALNKVSDDPRYIKFFKMLKYGAAPEAIKLKMAQEGVNPDFLDDPDAPAPEGAPPPPPPAKDSDDSSDDSDSDFSD